MYYIDAELLQVTCTNLAWKCRVCVRVDFSVCYAYACQALPLWSLTIDQKHCENKGGVHFLTPTFKCHIGRPTSYYCVILKMVILH